MFLVVIHVDKRVTPVDTATYGDQPCNTIFTTTSLLLLQQY